MYRPQGEVWFCRTLQWCVPLRILSSTGNAPLEGSAVHFCLLGTSTATVKLFQSARKIIMSSIIGERRWRPFLQCSHVEPPHNTTQASIVVSTVHPTEETTSSSDNYLARNHALVRCQQWQWHLSTSRMERTDRSHQTRVVIVGRRPVEQNGIQNLESFAGRLWVLYFDIM